MEVDGIAKDVPLAAEARVAGPRVLSATGIALLRAVSAQLILWHHLAFYGPLADIAAPLAPVLVTWLDRHGRVAVHVFFVLAGCTLGRALDPTKALGPRSIVKRVTSRYRRLAGHYLPALGLALVANEVAGRMMVHASVSARPTLPALLAHVFLLQDVLGHPAVSAGIWYLAIDLQLQLATLLLVALSSAVTRRFRGAREASAAIASTVAVVTLATVAILWLNRDARLDVWAPYYYGSYGLGVLVGWWSRSRVGRMAIFVLLVVAAAGLALDWRPRLAVAMGTTVLLLVTTRTTPHGRAPVRRALGYLGRSSYALFLVHFPVCLMVSAWWTWRGIRGPLDALIGMVTAWAASMAMAALLERVASRPRATHEPESEGPSV